MLLYLIMFNTMLTIPFFEVALRNHARHPRAPPHQRGDERCCRQEGQGVGQDIKGIFAGPKPEKVNRGERYFCHAEAVLRCGDRHLEVKVAVSIRQRGFVGLIGHPHVFLPIMGLRAEEPAGLGQPNQVVWMSPRTLPQFAP